MARITIRRCPVCPEKRVVATRVAARLREETGAEVELRWGGLGELSVEVDGRRVVDTCRFWFTPADRIVARVLAALAPAHTGATRDTAAEHAD
jgi:hypothetical protein